MTSRWSRVPARTRARIRAGVAATLPGPCSVCGLPVYRDAFDVDHLDPAMIAPERILDPTNWAPAHPGCNRARGARPLTTTGWSAPWL